MLLLLWFIKEGIIMENIVNLIVNNGIAVVVVGYFLFTNYKFNEKLVETLTRIDEKLDKEVHTIENNIEQRD